MAAMVRLLIVGSQTDISTRTLRNLQTNPFLPSLRLHPLSGELEGLHAVSVTYAYRITLTLRVTKKEIVLLDIGSHDEVYR